jgi:ABC-type lipoprotein export system ATPase subunit
MATVDEIMKLPQGAIWLKADLHVHTSASRDISPKWSKHTPEDVVRIAIDKGLDIIAITDHNTASNCDAIQKAAQDTQLTVFPGVEISTPQGHVLAIFDTGTSSSKIEDLLIKLEIPREQFASLDIATKFTIYDVCNFIEKQSAVAIAAHIDTKRGFIKMIDVAAERQRAYEAPGLRGLEIVDSSLRDKYQKGVSSPYKRRLACIQSSDCTKLDSTQHELDNIGSRFSFLKMGQRSLSGLKLALIDPDMRVRLQTDDNPTPKDSVIGMWVTGGFLDGQQFRFNDSVTCLIGDTGSGKSVCLELIRFALNQTPTVSKIKHEVDSLISQQLGSLGTVHIILKKDTSYYLVERTWGSPPTLPSISRILNGNIEKIEEEIDIRLFFPIKAFSQSEIIEFAREPTVRLSLTDDLIDCTNEYSKINELKLKLQQNAATTQVQLARREKILQELTNLPTLIESRTQIDSFLNDSRIQQHQLWYKEKTLLEQSLSQFSALEDSISGSFLSLRVEPPAIENPDVLPNIDLVTELSSIYVEWHALSELSRTCLTESAKQLLEKISSVKSRWDARFSEAELEYQKLIAEIDKDGKGLQALSDRRRRLEEQIASLEILSRELTADIIPQIATLEEERDSLLTDLQTNRKSITSKREAKAKELTEKLTHKIKLDVHSQANTNLFRQKLQQVAQGSGIRSNEYDTIAVKCHPVAFVKRILSEDYDYLSTQSGIDKNRFIKYSENVYDRKRLDELYELQLVDVEDVIEVMLDVGKSEYKPIETLAHGQKCMVVLMVALVEGQSPLIVDQPEDALHAPGIEEGIVSTLRSRRGVRQSIFATRNANIIVSADAEQILPLHADAHNGKLVGCGCLDSFDQRNLVVYHVEGGDEAFRRRQTKYFLRSN